MSNFDVQLFDACSNGNIATVKKLLEEPSTLNINYCHGGGGYGRGEYHHGDTALYAASNCGSLEIVNLLLTVHGISANVGEETPLLAACRNGNVEIVKRLLNVDAIDVNKTNTSTPLFFACMNGNIDIFNLLLQVEGIDINLGAETPLYAACINGNIEMVRALLKRDEIQVDKGTKNYEHRGGRGINQSPLYFMLENGNLQIAYLLLLHNANVTQECIEMAQFTQIDIDLLISQLYKTLFEQSPAQTEAGRRQFHCDISITSTK